MKHCTLIGLGLSLWLAQTASADSTLEYLIADSGAKAAKPQPVLIKDGKILVKGAGGDQNMDFIYSASPEQLFIIDHRKHSVMTLDEGQVNRIAKQTEAVQPLIQGFGEQLSRLNPKQRAKWENMLGGKVDLGAIAEAAKPVQEANIVKAGPGKVAGIACEQMNVFQGQSKMAEFCLAPPEKLKLSDGDYATIRSLLDFSERLASKTQGLARQFGVKIPNLDLRNLAGVPIEFRDVSRQNQGSLTLNRIDTTAVSADWMQLPAGYQSAPFEPWK